LGFMVFGVYGFIYLDILGILTTNYKRHQFDSYDIIVIELFVFVAVGPNE
jgi:hypothetical protein